MINYFHNLLLIYHTLNCLYLINFYLVYSANVAYNTFAAYCRVKNKAYKRATQAELQNSNAARNIKTVYSGSRLSI